MNPNLEWIGSLESYYPYLQPQEVSKAPTTSATYGSLPKSAKSHFGCHCPLGVNPIIPRALVFGIQGTLNRPRQKTRTIFHPGIFGTAE
jgi:hypothetical protein